MVASPAFGQMRYTALRLTLVALTFGTVQELNAAESSNFRQQMSMADQELWKARYPQADSLYNVLLRQNPSNTEVNWKLARLQISLGESLPPSQQPVRLRHYRQAENYARTAIAIDSTEAPAHIWLAASLGLMADKIGPQEKLKRAEEIKRALDTAVRLNPDDATAHSLLGTYYYEASKIGWFRRMIGNTFVGTMPQGNKELAEKEFRRSIALDPRMIRNYHDLAKLYLDMGRKAEAITLLKTALNKPILVESDKRRLEQIRELLRKHNGDGE
uniref:Regulator of microtubule dynamics protein 1 n=1 Tax=Chlorobium chlorochromatii (strain CaD3) TaxID=340177 RepID=Q3ARH2_CHLCH